MYNYLIMSPCKTAVYVYSYNYYQRFLYSCSMADVQLAQKARTCTLSARASCGRITVGCEFVPVLMKALKCKPLAQFACNYSIKVLSKCSSIISHRSSKVDTSIIEGRHIDLQRSTHRTSKVDTSISEGRHIDRLSSIFEGRHNPRY